jgi:hypothetical protein
MSLATQKQPEQALAAEERTLDLTPPSAVNGAAALLVLLAPLQFVVSILFIVHRSDIWSAVESLNPSLPAATVRWIVDGTIIGSLAIHTLIAILYVCLAVLIRKAQRFARIAASALLVISTLGGWLSLHASDNLIPDEWLYVLGEQGISLLLRVAALWALWGPYSSRSYFGTPRTRQAVH